MFSHNGANEPESKIKIMTIQRSKIMFRPVCQVAAMGAKSADSDCILFRKRTSSGRDFLKSGCPFCY